MSRDDGVAIVVGAVMLAAILAVAVATWRTSWLPAMQEEREVDHASAVLRGMSDLVTGMARQVRGQAAATLSQSLLLGLEAKDVPSMPSLSHALELAPGPGPLEVHAPSLLVVGDEHGRVLGPQETFLTVPGSVSITAVGPVESFRLKVHDVDRLQDGKNVRVTLKDSANRLAGTLEVRILKDPPDYYVIQETKDASGAVVTRLQESYFQQTDLAPYWVDLLDDRLRFDLLLASASFPLRIDIQEEGLEADYAITYDTVDDEGTLPGSNAGRLVSPFDRAFASDVLLYRASYPGFVDQTLAVEHGALLRTQGTRSVFLVQPSIAVHMRHAVVVLDVVEPSLRAGTEGATGVGSVSVRTTVANATHLQGWAANVSLVVHSAAVDAWKEDLLDAFASAGVPPSAYAVTTTGDRLVVDVAGTGSAGAYDVLLNLDRAVVRMEVGA